MSFPIVFNQLDEFNAELNDYALKNNRVNTSYHLAKNFLNKVLAKAQKDSAYCNQVAQWLQGITSTLELREILKAVGCDYWNNLSHSNACDYIDTVSCYFKSHERSKAV